MENKSVSSIVDLSVHRYQENCNIHRPKCKLSALDCHPDIFQYKDNSKGENIFLETGNHQAVCIADNLRLPRQTTKMIYQKCRKLSSEGLWPVFALFQSIGNRPYRRCPLVVIHHRMEVCKALGFLRMSRTQVEIAMQNASSFQVCMDGTDRGLPRGNNEQLHSV